MVPSPAVPDTAFAVPAFARLQETATQVQRELTELAGQVETAERAVGEAAGRVRAASAEREAAARVVAAQQAEVDAFTRSVFTARGRPGTFQLLLTATGRKDLLGGNTLLGNLRADQDARLAQALRRHRAAVAAEQEATRLEQEAARRRGELERRTADAVNRADAVAAELRGPVAEANAAVVAQQQAQRDRNGRTSVNWQSYLDRLAAAGITPPPASALRDPARLPAGLAPLPGTGGAQRGVAQATVDGQRILVLPKETVEAVGRGLGALGKPYVPRDGGAGPVAYSCDGLMKSLYAGLPDSAGEQMATAAPVPVADVQPGDLVFLGPARYGVQSVGMVLDGRTMLAADGRLAGVVVTDLPAGDTLLGAARPTLGTREAAEVPRRADGELVWRCGGIELPAPEGGPSGPWGGFPNGLIPASALCSLGFGSHALRCDAAQAFLAMSEAFAASFGRPLCLTDSYRTFASQVDLYRRKPTLAAVPGTSNHGWGLAVDLCGGAESFGTPEYAWLAANAGRFGWTNPPWARPGGGREEPWHWEF
ncbi:D-alanyl-D-alanine carboxypeptidase [Amycolatopsis suaedae]|uniref:D-alanyl-D-alanine carboxypeptidase n=2 Tax=Amycolatopsis suaedae TaxID=2510978 RepID=A0A4Q7IWZ0_9PSEU|nr:D-alanyl-D-alanine carboxypeptidase [Amycolatopsis suaedae]